MFKRNGPTERMGTSSSKSDIYFKRAKQSTDKKAAPNDGRDYTASDRDTKDVSLFTDKSDTTGDLSTLLDSGKRRIRSLPAAVVNDKGQLKNSEVEDDLSRPKPLIGNWTGETRSFNHVNSKLSKEAAILFEGKKRKKHTLGLTKKSIRSRFKPSSTKTVKSEVDELTCDDDDTESDSDDGNASTTVRSGANNGSDPSAYRLLCGEVPGGLVKSNFSSGSDLDTSTNRRSKRNNTKTFPNSKQKRNEAVVSVGLQQASHTSANVRPVDEDEEPTPIGMIVSEAPDNSDSEDTQPKDTKDKAGESASRHSKHASFTGIGSSLYVGPSTTSTSFSIHNNTSGPTNDNGLPEVESSLNAVDKFLFNTAHQFKASGNSSGNNLLSQTQAKTKSKSVATRVVHCSSSNKAQNFHHQTMYGSDEDSDCQDSAPIYSKKMSRSTDRCNTKFGFVNRYLVKPDSDSGKRFRSNICESPDSVVKELKRSGLLPRGQDMNGDGTNDRLNRDCPGSPDNSCQGYQSSLDDRNALKRPARLAPLVVENGATPPRLPSTDSNMSRRQQLEQLLHEIGDD